MRRISLAVALAGAIAAAGCSGGNKAPGSGSSAGTPGSTYTLAVRGDAYWFDASSSTTVVRPQGGTITSTPAGINCGPAAASVCSYDFPWGSSVTLSVAYAGTNTIHQFAGACTGNAGCTVTGNADKTVFVRFAATATGLRGHPNWSAPADHAPKYRDYVADVADGTVDSAYDCKACHGQQLKGSGLAVSCFTCHTSLPGGGSLPAVTPPAGGIAGVVTDRTEMRVAGAQVYAIPTGLVKADSIYLPPHWATGNALTVVSYHEGVYKLKAAGDAAVAPLWPPDAADANWDFVAVVHTPHAFSSRNAYKTGDLVLFANTSAEGTFGDPGYVATNTRFAVYEAELDTKGSAENAAYEGGQYWTTFATSTTVSPPATATGSNAYWHYIGDAKALAYFDNIPETATKTYARGAIVRNSNAIYWNNTGAAAAFSTSTWTNLGSLVSLARTSETDEPIEDTIRVNTQLVGATTDANGVYTLPALPASWTGRYYICAIPAGSTHLPGGELTFANGSKGNCRTPSVGTAVAGTQVDISVSGAPAANATFVGPTKCLSCHADMAGTKMTLHGLGIRRMIVDGTTGRPGQGGNQDYSKFEGATKRAGVPEFYEALADFEAGKFFCVDTSAAVGKYWDATAAGTCTTPFTNLVDANGVATTASPTIAFSLKLGSEVLSGKKYYTITLKNLGGATTPWTGSNPDGSARSDGKYFVELSYGGGIHKQRYLAKIGAQRWTLPLQYNFEGQTMDKALLFDADRLKWQGYNNGDWYTNAGFVAKVPGAYKSFDSMCAGCHFTGYKLDLAANKATGALDVNGEMAFNSASNEMINLSCETCHGPGSTHVSAGGAAGIGIVNPSKITPEREVTICSACHTRFVGKGGVRNAGALATEAPLMDIVENATTVSVMPRPGISRQEFLTNHVNSIGDGMHNSLTGNGKYARQHHQQASDFLTTEKYRNVGLPRGGWSIKPGKAGLQACSSCHDLHGAANKRQLIAPLEVKVGTTTTAGLCTTCHDKNLGGTGHTARGAPSSGATSHINVASWTCASCHVPLTAKSGSGAPSLKIGSDQFFRGDISSHLFIGVPYAVYAAPSKLSTEAKAQAAKSIMPIPYTNACGSCHTKAKADWNDGYIQ